jgi:hypothetical protein
MRIGPATFDRSVENSRYIPGCARKEFMVASGSVAAMIPAVRSRVLLL